MKYTEAVCDRCGTVDRGEYRSMPKNWIRLRVCSTPGNMEHSNGDFCGKCYKDICRELDRICDKKARL